MKTVCSNDVLNSQKAAELLGVHVETIRRMVRHGDIPSFKIGIDWRLNQHSLFQWMERHHSPANHPNF